MEDAPGTDPRAGRVRELETALEEERRQLREFVTHAPVALAILDPELRYVAHSDTWRQYWGLGPDELAGRSHLEAFPAARRQEDALRRALAGEAVTRNEDAFELPGGARVYVRWTMHPWRGAAGDVGGVLVAVQSIDTLVRAREAALASARQKSRFLSAMSHAIRTPLSGLVGMGRLLLETALNPEQQQYTQMICRAGDTLLGMVNDVVDLSAMEAGRLELESVDFELRTLVEDVAASMAGPAAARGLDLACLIHHEVPSALRGDPSRLRRILARLLTRAVASTTRGEVVLRTSLTASAGETVVVRFEVKDTGVGLGAEELERLFDVSPEAEAVDESEGLGLSVTRKLVERMGGTLTAESEAGRGSLFAFSVRLQRQQHKRVPLGRAELRGRNALVVDANETSRLGLQHQLASFGMRVATAADAPAALAALRQAAVEGAPVDVALLDVDLSRVRDSGLALARTLHEDPALAGVRVVLLATVGRAGHSSQAERAGVAAYLTKPVRQSQLQDCVAAVLDVDRGDVPTTAPLITRHLLAEAQEPLQVRVLVAEDDEVSQVIAARMLERLGYKVDLARNGAEAVEACAEREYAAVLMDCHMPVMDGFEATRRIRQAEGGGRRCPILALTASAVAADHDRSRAAGMDDVLSKPVAQPALEAALERWLRRGSEPEPAPPGAVEAVDGSFLDSLRPLENGRILAEVIGTFLRRAPERLDALSAAVRARDCDSVELLAQGLKGNCGNLGAHRMTALAAELEQRGRSGDLAGCAPLLDELRLELQAVSSVLQRELQRLG